MTGGTTVASIFDLRRARPGRDVIVGACFCAGVFLAALFVIDRESFATGLSSHLHLTGDLPRTASYAADPDLPALKPLSGGVVEEALRDATYQGARAIDLGLTLPGSDNGSGAASTGGPPGSTSQTSPPPGQGIGPGGTPPGQGGTPPGKSGSPPPGKAGNPPGNGGIPPGQAKKPSPHP